MNNDKQAKSTGLPTDAGNGMSSRSEWAEDVAPNTGGVEGTPSADAGTGIGGDPTRMTDQAEDGVPHAPGYGEPADTGTTFDADPADDKVM